MIQSLIHDPILLSIPAAEATAADASVGQDLLDTLEAHKDSCVGMAANMIGQRKRIIVFCDDSGKKPVCTVLYNPEIVSKSGPYDAEEGCLSFLGGPTKCRRFRVIKVRYQTSQMQPRQKTFTGWTAQIIQHEIDHCNGVLI